MKSRWKRIVLWSVLGVVIAVVALGGGFYVWFQHQVGSANARIDPSIVEALKEKPSTTTAPTSQTGTSGAAPGSSGTAASAGGTPTTAPYGSPSGMNIVLLGYDLRMEGSTEVTEGRSDVIILVHIDPEKGFLSLLSVPRDLRVDLGDPFGHRKINAAYAYGGGALLIRTIQDRLGVDLDHYIAVDLEAFKAITNSLGGVYVDVDRTYDDGKIELDAGYQLLDGLNAERFVRTRHDSNIDFGRMARQQRYLSSVRQQAMGWNLTLKLPGLIKTIFRYADTDMSSTEVLKLAYWVMKLDSGGIKRAEIIGATGDINGSFYILPTDKELAASVQDFFTPPLNVTRDDTLPPAPTTFATLSSADLGRVAADVVDSTGRAGQGALAGLWLWRQGATVGSITTGETSRAGIGAVQYPGSHEAEALAVAQALGIPGVEKSADVDRVTVVLGEDYAIDGQSPANGSSGPLRLASWQALQKQAGISLMAPTYLPYGFIYSFDRSYDIDTGDGVTKPAVRVGYRYRGLDLYAGVSATTWTEAPLAAPGKEVEVGGITYTVVGAANKPDHAWWVKEGVLYWVSNTIFGDLTREQLLAIAFSSVAVPPEE